jgi:hypothetical protein
MRYILVADCDYEQFEKIRDDCILLHGFITGDYSKKLKLAKFWFWDSDYIPEQYRKYIVAPSMKAKVASE